MGTPSRGDSRAAAVDALEFGLPLTVTRSHPDFPALWVAKTWLGEHRASNSYLYQRIRELRGPRHGRSWSDCCLNSRDGLSCDCAIPQQRQPERISGRL